MPTRIHKIPTWLAVLFAFTGMIAGAIILIPTHAKASGSLSLSISERLESGNDTPIDTIPTIQALKLNSRIVSLGDKLFHERRLSKNAEYACADCHNLNAGGTDQLITSKNSSGNATKFNTPTVFNVALNYAYYWSGKFDSLDDQLTDALKEINTTWPEVIATLNSIPEYKKEFTSLYEDGITEKNIKDTFITFQRSLVTPNSRFDQYLNGNKAVLTSLEKEGYKLFKSYGCISCHQGTNIGGNVILDRSYIMKMVIRNDRGNLLSSDLSQIRVPSLRNVAVTYPYFHDGSATTLDQAIRRMIRQYVGIDAPKKDVVRIAEFLKTLTGEYKGSPL